MGQLSADSSSKETLYCWNSCPQKFDVLKTNSCPRSEASNANMLVLRTSSFQGGNYYQTDREKHAIVLNVYH